MPDHYADTRPAATAWRVSLEGRVLLESADAVELVEHYKDRSFPTVVYFAPAAVAHLDLQRTETSTRCPIKGTASYFRAQGVADGVWSYESPLPGVATIAGHRAFDGRKGFVVEAVSS